jgi:predicted O-methyltransferase YrrM
MRKSFEQIWPMVQTVKGFLTSPAQEEWLYNAASDVDGDILEVGSFMGRSTCCLAYACEGTKRKVYAIDPFYREEHTDLPKEYEDIFLANVEKCGLAQYVMVMRGRSIEFMSHDFGALGMVFIDGSHEYEDVRSDFFAYSQRVKSGGWIALHDVCTHEGPTRLWYEVKAFLADTGTCGNLSFGRKV